ncbi:MAG: triphosphoribosyl-dephospho-CoA synthase [Bacteroidales bacterium]|nr:triphosphoribosyl-dephospho-CoA synthase [Bacteroidales bacterium]
MQTYGNWDIQELPLSSPYFYKQLEQFLASNGLRMEKLDRYLTVQADGKILAGAGFYKDIIKCVAVAQEARSEGLVAPLVSRLIADASASGIHNLKVFTKPENQAIFESLGFRLLAEAPKAVLMENGKGLERYCEYLKGFRRPGRSGVIVMNSNPLTLGHKYLIDKASEQVDNLYIIPVKEDLSLFPYSERLEMIRLASEKGTEVCSASAKNNADATAEHTSIPNSYNVTVLEGSDYIISEATFPTYFLKEKSDAAETQMLLDLDLYSRWIAPALDASVRFVGSEPLDALTAQYNTLIPNAVIIPRLEMASAGPAASDNYFFGRCQKKQFPEAIANLTHADAISASKVRKALEEGSFREAASMCPESTWPYLLGQLAERALRLELDTPMKPGLVCPESSGAHKDMDYALMLKGISAIRPFFPKMAKAKSADELRQLGIEAEKAMMEATGGVNTHRGAIFAFGLTLNAVMRSTQLPYTEEVMQNALCQIAQGIFDNQLKDNTLVTTHFLTGARKMAAEGYKELFEDWLPYYRTLLLGKEVFSSAKNYADATEKTSFPLQMLLLRIMSTLEDTCVIKRVGYEKAQQVKQEAAVGQLQEMCARYAQEGISPGGAADMLALTIFIDSIIV